MCRASRLTSATAFVMSDRSNACEDSAVENVLVSRHGTAPNVLKVMRSMRFLSRGNAGYLTLSTEALMASSSSASAFFDGRPGGERGEDDETDELTSVWATGLLAFL